MKYLLLPFITLISACPFCDTEILARQTFYEEQTVAAVYTHKPILPAHFLIIPKRHVTRFEELTSDELLAIQKVIKHVDKVAINHFGTSSYLLLQKNGKEMGQSVSHLHFHYIAGKINALSFFSKMIWANLKGPLSHEQLQKMIMNLKTSTPQLLNTVGALHPDTTIKHETNKGLSIRILSQQRHLFYFGKKISRLSDHKADAQSRYHMRYFDWG